MNLDLPTYGELNEHLPYIWELLSDEQRAIIRKNGRLYNFTKNEHIYRTGATPAYLMCLITGKAKIFKEGLAGKTQITRMVCPREYFGYRAFFANETYQTSAVAFELTTVYFLPMPVVQNLILTNTQLGLFFIRELARDLGNSELRTLNLTQKHIRGRLAESLLFLRDSYGVEEDNMTINIYLSREDLANLSNMTASNAIRTLSHFVDERIIIMDGRRIKIVDETRLKKICQIG
ncbi:MAG: Crp/Fnr family transcriptional regulator [Bacteroidales bacterium]|jgi:CRP-like cAMP-binding protein|nr:Crp/Fnr family transcriptional regulator [Bacteroidales bacterium]